MTSFIVSDWHFNHKNSWEKFKRGDGSPLRPYSSNEEMNEALIENHNRVVNPGDHVYCLGDVAINKSGLEFVKRLNGKKRLILGNHDIFSNKQYYEAGFEKLAGVRVFVDKWILSHIPLHPDSVTDRFRVNVHGHLHFGEVMWTNPNTQVVEADPRYFCASVEMVNFTPISFDELDLKINSRWEASGYDLKNSAWGNGSNPG